MDRSAHLHPVSAARRRRCRERGLSLVETLIAVLIIGILAALVVPQFSDAAGQSRAGNTLAQLHSVRIALSRYRLDHDGAYPPADSLWGHLTAATNARGKITPGGSLGPYLTAAPRNIYTDSTAVTTDLASMDLSFGWYYDPQSPQPIRAVGFDEKTQTFSTTPMS